MRPTALRKPGRGASRPGQLGSASQDKPLPLALCLALWAAMAAVAWALVALVVQLA